MQRFLARVVRTPALRAAGASLLCTLFSLPVSAQEVGHEKPAESQSSAEKPVYKLGSTVDEALTLTDLDGKSVRFADLRGKVVLIHFWSSTCPYETFADPKLAALEKRWKDKDVVVLAIDANVSEIGATPTPDLYRGIKEHLKKKALSFPVYADHGNRVADLFQARSTPHCFVLDRKGVLVYAGGLDDDPKGTKGDDARQYVRDAVESVLAGEPVEVKESQPYGCSIKRLAS